jgi:hypothetical protein
MGSRSSVDGIVTRLWVGRFGDEIPLGATDFLLFSKTSRTALGPIYRAVPWAPAFFAGDEAAGT